MIVTKEDIIKLLASIGKFCKTKLNAYILGGAALTLREIKDSTIDIDVIVENKKSYNIIVESLTTLGFHRKTKMKFQNPITNEIIDIDYGKFMRLKLYDIMKRRAEFMGVYYNLNVYILSNEHILLFKSITERKKDIEDIMFIIKYGNINWNMLINDALIITEKELYEKREKAIIIIYELYSKLKTIKEENSKLIPENAMKKLEKYAEKYINK